MATISFDEEPDIIARPAITKKPFLVRLVLSTKIVTTDKQAEYVLIGIAVFCVLLTIVLWPKGPPAANPSEVPPIAGPLDTTSAR
ncbi:MAG: hypothetical protein V4682_03490 [Patescibacteria group bacterium]